LCDTNLKINSSVVSNARDVFSCSCLMWTIVQLSTTEASNGTYWDKSY
jgi:hypothetical protein